LEFIDFTLDFKVPQHLPLPDSQGEKPQRKRVLVARSEKVRIPRFKRPAVVANVIDVDRREYPVYHANGGFYVRAASRLDPVIEKALSSFFNAGESRYDVPLLRESDLQTVGQRFAVHAGDGVLIERIHEPVWLVETRDTGGRMNTRENAKQGISIRLSYTPHRPIQDFDGGPVPLSGSPFVMFAAARGEDADALLPEVVAEIEWGQIERYRTARLEVLRPELFTIDDRAATLRMIGPMMLALGHAVCRALSRAGIEHWLDLRRHLATHPSDEREYAETQDAVAGLLRELRGLRSEDKEVDVMLKRARNCAAMLVLRLDVDNTYEHTHELDGDRHGWAP
jgi:hypothetical protein